MLRLAGSRQLLALVPTLLLVLVAQADGPGLAGSRRSGPPPNLQSGLSRLDQQMAQSALDLPAATDQPQPLTAAAVDPLKEHEVFGFAPYWTLNVSAGFDVQSLTTLAYFGVDVTRDGSVVRSGNGWTGYESQALTALIDRAHAANSRLVLTAKAFDQPTLDSLAGDPNAAGRLAAELTDLLKAKNLDGVNLDFEGQGPGDRSGIANLVTGVSKQLHTTNPHWQVTVDTYAGAAGDQGGFFDIGAMAPVVDAMFVMAYDMHRSGVASPNAPLPADEGAVRSYLNVAPAEKLLLGVPFYGYDWPTKSNRPNSDAAGPPQPRSYGELASAGHTVYWDPNARVPWTAYQQSTQWHEAYYDNPQSVALKAQLVARYGLRGVGIWALGMDGNDPRMMAAVLGSASPFAAANGPGTSSYSSSPSNASSSSASSSSGQPSPSPSGTAAPPGPGPSPSAGPTPKPLPPPPPSPTPIVPPLPSPPVPPIH